MKKFNFVIYLLFFATPLLSHSNEYDGLYDDGKWSEVDSKDGLVVFTRNMPNTKLLGFKLEGVIHASIEQIMANIRNVEQSSDWTPDLKEKSTIEEISDLEAVTYSRNDLSWPLSDRDFVTHNKLFIHKEKKLLYVISKSIVDNRYPPRKNVVRAWLHYSNIGMRPVGKNQTYLEWTIFADPKGKIPTWLVNFYQRGFPIKFFKAVEKRARSTNIPLKQGMNEMLVELKKVMSTETKITSDK